MDSASLADFEIVGILGKGSFSSVFLARRKADKKQYAIKSVQLTKLSSKEQENSINEARILASIDHPNIIGYKECFLNYQNQFLYIVMEHADGGDLLQKINEYKKAKKLFDENQIWSYAIQIINGLKELHDKKIIHRDLKSANIYLMKDHNICKIGDLNMSKSAKGKLITTKTGTPYYCSPEVWQNKPYSYKSDLWSIGCIIYELCELHPPFRGKNYNELCNNVCNRKIVRINKNFTDDLWKIILMLLEVDVKKRIDCDEFLKNKIVIKKTKELKLENNFTDNDNSIYTISSTSVINLTNMNEVRKKLPYKKKYNNGKEAIDEYEDEDDDTIKNDDSVNGTIYNSSNQLKRIKELKKGISKSTKIIVKKKLELDYSLKKYRKIKSALKTKYEEKYPLLINPKKKKNIKTNVIKTCYKKFLIRKKSLSPVNSGKNINKNLTKNKRLEKVLNSNFVNIKKIKDKNISTSISINQTVENSKTNKTSMINIKARNNKSLDVSNFIGYISNINKSKKIRSLQNSARFQSKKFTIYKLVNKK